MVNSTFYNNSAPVGGAVDCDAETTMVFTNCTFSENYSEMAESLTIENLGTVTLTNTIISGNGTDPNRHCSGSGTLHDGGGNLRWTDDDTTCPGPVGDPLLQPLAGNGGPTPTMALREGSAAIRLAAAHCPALDQRNYARLDGPTACDAGSYEFGAKPGGLLYLPLILNRPAI